MERPTLVIVGNGMVGQKLVDLLVAGGALEAWRIVVLGEEPHPAYDRVALSSWFDGASEADLRLVADDLLATDGLEYRLSCAVTAIDADARWVGLDDGTVLPFEHLVLATGSSPFVPPVPGHGLPGCFVYRTLDDLAAIRDWALAADRHDGAVIGGGLLGLEAANALRALHLDTHVVEMAPRLMPQQLDEPASAMLRRWVEGLGVHVHTGVSTEEVVADPASGAVTGLRFADLGVLPVDLVVFSAGIRPRDELARSAGLAVGPRGGVVVDDLCRASAPGVHAIGEVACHRDRVHGLVAPGYEMARVVADQLLGVTTDGFAPREPSTKLKLLGVDVAAFGTTMAGDDHEELVLSDPIAKVHRKLVVDRSTGGLVGGILVGDAEGFDLLALMASGDLPTPTELVSFLAPAAGGAAPGLGTLPDAAQICTCNAVTKGTICQAVVDGARTAKEVGAATSAGTACGGCVPTVTTLLNSELDQLGIEVDRRLCEHFATTRQELFDLVRIHRHRSWREVLAAHGIGRGCEVCRPVVASILASQSNGHVLDGDRAAVQDTNDHVLANMQRNGTYSVVPRVPGGEITPHQLIALGEIARDFDLYCKITGGQRIDLLGARLDQLPAIWERVIAAGMESGHAYGKALRTVKSCVGDTWCRYGVQDSVSMAIQIELRYRGLRAPHKIKAAVSGCTRECAEARSKDVGVIATEAGWNLYVGGNGGSNPRHADLFAADLDDDTLIRYIDRFLMFYVRTADRLQRTAPWVESFEGGLDHLREVVIHDSLGIAAELEADMARHVDSYEDEWAATLADPVRRERFVEFVNVPDQAVDLGWSEVRGQRVPVPVRRGERVSP